MVDAVMTCMCHTISDSLIWLFTVSVALVSVLSAVGICERCRMESGGVYFLVSHVLGSKFGGALGLLYVFGQVSIMADMSKSLAFVEGKLSNGLAVEVMRFLNRMFNPLNTELNPICHLLALLGAHHILHVSRIRAEDSVPTSQKRHCSFLAMNNLLTFQRPVFL